MAEEGTIIEANAGGGVIRPNSGALNVHYGPDAATDPLNTGNPVCFVRSANPQVAETVWLGNCPHAIASHLTAKFLASLPDDMAVSDPVRSQVERIARQRTDQLLALPTGEEVLSPTLAGMRIRHAESAMELLALEALNASGRPGLSQAKLKKARRNI